MDRIKKRQSRGLCLQLLFANNFSYYEGHLLNFNQSEVNKIIVSDGDQKVKGDGLY